MIILNEIMDTMSKEKRAIIVDRIDRRQRYRKCLGDDRNRHASEVGERALKSNIKKYGITSELPRDYLRNEDIISKDMAHVYNQYDRLFDKKNKKLDQTEAPEIIIKPTMLSKVALGAGVGAAAAYGIHRYRKNKKEEARRQAEAEAKKKSSSRRFFK